MLRASLITISIALSFMTLGQQCSTKSMINELDNMKYYCSDSIEMIEYSELDTTRISIFFNHVDSMTIRRIENKDAQGVLIYSSIDTVLFNINENNRKEVIIKTSYFGNREGYGKGNYYKIKRIRNRYKNKILAKSITTYFSGKSIKKFFYNNRKELSKIVEKTSFLGEKKKNVIIFW